MPRARPKLELTPERLAIFAKALAEGDSIHVAVKRMGVEYRVAVRWRNQHPEFARLWAEAATQGDKKVGKQYLFI